MPGRCRANPVQMGEEALENSSSEKYLGDMIIEKGAAASITEKTDQRLPELYPKIDEILAVCKNPKTNLSKKISEYHLQEPQKAS